MASTSPGGDGAAPQAGTHASLAALAATIARSARDVFAHVVEIAALESRLAVVALVVMAGLALGAVVLVLSAWGLLVAAGVYGLMTTGMATPAALLLAVAVNLGIAALLVVIVLRLVPRVKFAATRRALEQMRSKA